jgi:hypothetical protein
MDDEEGRGFSGLDPARTFENGIDSETEGGEGGLSTEEIEVAP